MFTDPFNTLSVFDKTASLALYLTIALLLIILIIGLLVKKFKSDNLKQYCRSSFSAIIGYSVALVAILLFLKLDEYIAEGYIDYTTFIPIVILVGVIFLLGVIGLILSLLNKDKLPLFSKIAICIISVGLLAILITQTIKYYQNNDSIKVSDEVQLYIYTVLIVLTITLLTMLLGKKKDSSQNRTKMISYASICASLSFALSYIRFIELPQGGSVTFVSLLPLMLFSYKFGIRKGVLLGFIYGFLQFIQAPWFYHPVQFLLDYPIAFASIGLAGIFKEKKLFENKKPLQFALGAILSVVLRYLSHVVSGIFVFGSGDPNYSAVAWSFLYNSFTLADMAICLVAGCTLFASKTFVKIIEKNN